MPMPPRRKGCRHDADDAHDAPGTTPRRPSDPRRRNPMTPGPRTPPLDLLGVGAGPFNLSLAALADGVPGLRTVFHEQRAGLPLAPRAAHRGREAPSALPGRPGEPCRAHQPLVLPQLPQDPPQALPVLLRRALPHTPHRVRRLSALGEYRTPRHPLRPPGRHGGLGPRTGRVRRGVHPAGSRRGDAHGRAHPRP